MTQDEILSVLFALHDLARADVPAHAGEIGLRLGLSATRVGEGLVHLERRGLADAARVRLTMQGLVIARAFAAHARHGTVLRAA
jgi:Mn-dependent DtxR family transcriptional regulator